MNPSPSSIRLRSGKYLDLVDPDPDDILFDDIAHALCNLCRFTGQCEPFYSVLDHSINAAELALHWYADKRVAFACLMHDAAEAYLGDLSRPLKTLLPTLAEYELRIEHAINTKFGVPCDPETKALVKEVDNALLIAERDIYFTPDNIAWIGENTVRPVPFGFVVRTFHREQFKAKFELLRAS